MKDLLRKYPQWSQDCLAVVGTVSGQSVQEPRAKAALIWMMGEYGEHVDDAPYTLEALAEGWAEDQTPEVLYCQPSRLLASVPYPMCMTLIRRQAAPCPLVCILHTSAVDNAFAPFTAITFSHILDPGFGVSHTVAIPRPDRLLHLLPFPSQVRMELLTAAAKLFFKRPPESQKLLGKVLSQGLQDSNQVCRGHWRTTQAQKCS